MLFFRLGSKFCALLVVFVSVGRLCRTVKTPLIQQKRGTACDRFPELLRIRLLLRSMTLVANGVSPACR
jgi:hypothetical protein